MRKAVLYPIGPILLALGAALAAEAPPAYKVVVNAANPKAAADRTDVADIFLRKATRWPDGSFIAPVDQSIASSARQSFSSHVLRQSISTVQEYWRQQIFAGREVPPAVKVGDQDVIAFVQANPGAIGYVSADAKLPEGVKVLKVVP